MRAAFWPASSWSKFSTTVSAKRFSSRAWAPVSAVPQVATTSADALLDRARDVEVALHQHRALPLHDRVARPVEAVEDAALRVDGRLGRVQVLGLAAVEAARAERDHLARLVQDREDRAVAEAVVVAFLALALEHEAGLQQQRRSELAAQRAEQVVPGVARGAGADLLERLLLEAAAEQVLARLRAGGGPERAREVLRRRFHEREQLLALLAVGPGLDAPLGHRDAEAPRQRLDRLGEARALAQHHELEDVAALAAAEAVEDGRLLAHVERRALLLVERAQALPRGAGLLERHVLGDHLHDVRHAAHVLDEALGKGHR